jgi:hypothetical protein
MNEKKIRELAMEYGLKCDPLNQTLEKQADIRQGFIEGMNQALILCGVSNPKGTVCLDHDWKGDSFDHFGFCLEEVCENCGEKRQTGC